MSETHVGVGSAPRRLNECYVGVGGVPRSVKEIYVGVGGVPRLAWSMGINRLYFSNSTGVGEINVETFAVIQSPNNIGYSIFGLGGMRRQLFAFDNKDSSASTGTTCRIMELDIKSRAVMRVVLQRSTLDESGTQIGGTNTKLYKSNTRIVQHPKEIDPQTFATIREGPFMNSGRNGVGSTSSRIGFFIDSGDSYYQSIMHECNPDTLAIIRTVTDIMKYTNHTGTDNQIFAIHKYEGAYKDVVRMDTETLAVVQSGTHTDYWCAIGGTKS